MISTFRFGFFHVSASRWFSLLLLVSTITFGAETSSDQVRLLSIHSQIYVTPLTRWDENNWEIEKPDPQEIPTSRIVAVDWLNRPVTPPNHLSQVILVNGDRLSLSIDGWNEEALSGTSLVSGKESIRIPLEYVRGLILRPTQDLHAYARELDRVARHIPGDDLVTLANGDQVRGQIIRLENENFLFEREGMNVSLPKAQVSTLILNPQLSIAPPDPGQAAAYVTLVDGSRLTLNDWHKTGDELTGSLLGIIPVTVPLAEISGIRPRNTDVQMLSDLTPEAFQFTPFLPADATLNYDGNSLGGPLLVRNRLIPKGIGLHSRSETTYPLNGNFNGFLTTLAIDDAAGNQGSAEVTIFVDGMPRYKSPLLRGGEPSVQTPVIDLSRAAKLTIMVDFGEEADVLDLVDLCDPILTR